MNMKKLFLFSVAALAFAACSNDEIVSESATANQPQEIAISPLTQNTTRTAADTYQYAIDGTTFPTDLNMYVAAYQVSPTSGTPAAGTNYFPSTRFVYNNAGGASGTSGYWGGATARYWPLSPAYINFLAYANVTGTATFDNTTPASAATITQSDNSSAQTDLMYAIGSGEVTQTGNALSFPSYVSMEFKHAQAWISFRVKAATTVEQDITINSITLNGAKYAGTYTITHTNYNQNSSQSVAGAWTSLGDAKNVAVPGWTASALTNAFVTVGNGLMIVPDDADTGDFTSFTINYTYDSKTYDYTYTPVSTNVEQKKHYIYDITFTLHEIFVSATVEDWADQTTNYVDVPMVTMANSSLQTVTLPNEAGVYSFAVTGFTSGHSASVAEKTDNDNIISAVATNATVPTGGAVTVEVTKPETANGKEATITLTVNSATYDITIKTPVTSTP